MKNKTIRIGIDVDETICFIAQDILDILNLKNNTNHSLEEITEYRIEKCLNVSDEDIKFAVKTAIYNDPEFIEDAVTVINWLSASANIYFLTARPSEDSDITHKLLFDLGLIQPYYVFLNCDKVDIINKLEIDYMIEDRAKYAEDIIDNTSCIVLLLDKPWNRHAKSHDRLTRVYNWGDIILFFVNRLNAVTYG